MDSYNTRTGVAKIGGSQVQGKTGGIVKYCRQTNDDNNKKKNKQQNKGKGDGEKKGLFRNFVLIVTMWSRKRLILPLPKCVIYSVEATTALLSFDHKVVTRPSGDK